MYLITGATGNVGRNVVNQLVAQGEQVRVFTRNAAKLSGDGLTAQVALGDFTQPETFRAATDGVNGIFLMNATTPINAFEQFLEVAGANGSTRIVFLSSIAAAEPTSAIGKLHLEKEEAVRASGLPSAFLRPGGFMSNVLGWLTTIKSESTVYNPMGSGLYAPIAPEDIAAAAVHLLLSCDLSGQVYDLTGGELINTPRQVDVISDILNRPIRIVDIDTETAKANLIRSGIPEHIAAGVAKSFENIRQGKGAQATDTLARLIGRSPMSFKDWASRHVDRFV